ncbi:hypothetical protein ACFXPI_02415 [Streptomyces sp. NPDC059104]|uniref:hypothetical protein n=1 Tax=Streptomyces sp. NPDC059104 TaxID=3346729 RepID=UPI0036874265
MNMQEYSFTVWALALTEAKEYLSADNWEDFRQEFSTYCEERMYDIQGFSDIADDLWRHWSESLRFPSDALELAALVKEYAHNASIPDPYESPADAAQAAPEDAYEIEDGSAAGTEGDTRPSVEGAYRHVMQTVPGAAGIPMEELLSVMLETIDTAEPAARP